MSAAFRPVGLLLALLSSCLVLIGSPRQDPAGPVPTFHVVALVGGVDDPARFGKRVDIKFPSGEFPQWFSALATGLPIQSRINPNLLDRLPSGLTMLDICTFYGSEADSKKNRWDKRQNGSRFSYRLAAVSWTPDDYVVELESWGLHRVKPFQVSGSMTSTTLTGVPVKGNRFLFFAVTPQSANPYIPAAGRNDNGVSRWRLVEKADPVFPEDMRLNRNAGLVVFALKLTPEGRVDARRQMLLECNHLSFCRAAAEALSQWRYDVTELDLGSDPIGTASVRFVLLSR